jgi:hypothetical protein
MFYEPLYALVKGQSGYPPCLPQQHQIIQGWREICLGRIQPH